MFYSLHHMCDVVLDSDRKLAISRGAVHTDIQCVRTFVHVYIHIPTYTCNYTSPYRQRRVS